MSDAASAVMLPVNLQAYEALAATRLPRMVYDYYAGGANDELLLRESRTAWDALHIRYRVLRDVAQRDLAVTIGGQRLDWPIIVAPMAFQQMATSDGEVATARATSAAGCGMILSTLSNRTIEAVRAASNGLLWFQLYIYRDRDVTAALVRRAEQAGCTGLVLTVDTPLLGRRERDLLNGFHLPAHFGAPNLGVDMRSTLGTQEDLSSALAQFILHHWDAGIAWRDLSWLRSLTDLPIYLKGVVRGDDAMTAIEHGVSGIIVSNHGGRQLDTAVPTAVALAEVAHAVDGRATVLVDGGIRRGTDVLKALALGAHAVLLGRPILWGLAANGEAGAAHVLQLLRDEVDLAFALAGVRSAREATRDLIA